MAARGFIGAGDIYIERMVAGVPQGLAGPYFANKFEIKPNVDKKELTSKGRNTYGQVLESVSVQKPADFTMELSEVNTESMTLALLGTIASSAQTGGALVDEVVTTKEERWVPVGKSTLGDAIVVKNDAGSTTYVEGTDYLLNRPLGLIKALESGAITPAQVVEISGPYGATSSVTIAGATNVDIRARIVFDGKNMADGLPVVVTIHEGIIAADSAFDFLADDFNVVNLVGTMKTPADKTEPFTVELRSA